METFELKPGNISEEERENIKSIFEKTYEVVNRDEAGAWDWTHKLRDEFEESHEEFFEKIEIKTIEQAQKKGYMVIRKVLEGLDGVIDLSKIEAAHGVGHFARDYIHSMILAAKSGMDPRQAYVGVVAGSLHDILGCALVERYAEKGRAVRHAEAGALLFSEISKIIDVDPDEAKLISYVIAAHTRYSEPGKVECSDGVEREIRPYDETDKEGKPIMSIVLARWADRFDVNGSCFVGRHFLTLAKEHFDYASDTGKFYRVGFDAAMRPLLRDKEEIAIDPLEKTMREHLQTYADSQSNDSPYGKFDYGKMAEMRDAYKERLLTIINSFDSPIKLSSEEEKSLLDKWTRWLSKNIEPSESGFVAAGKLREMFSSLPRETKEAWFSAMETTIKEYDEWSQEMLKTMSEFPEEMMDIPLVGNIRDIVRLSGSQDKD